ncbi:MAG: PilZ domain-containing protein [Gammaproteobacteria bacterium]
MNTCYAPERRHHLRRSVVTNVQLEHVSLGKIMGSSVNISDSGILLLIDALVQRAFPVGSTLRFSLLDSISPEIIFSARVVRSTEQGLAVQLLAYEYQGAAYPLHELRRQWFMSQRDLSA